MRVGVVTAFVPLSVRHMSASQYHEFGKRLETACKGAHAWVLYQHPIEECWLYAEKPPMVPANPVPGDRYAGPVENVFSNIVQHNRTTWALKAARDFPDVDVWVWFDYGLLKQGFWKNNPVTEEHVAKFLERVASTPAPLDFIPFPGITEQATVYPTGNVWRFCGSTHLWPKHYLADIDQCYKNVLRKWIAENKTTPLDLPIWALVEQQSKLPFRWYPAEYDATQLTNYPWGQK